MKRAHLVLLVVTAVMALFSAYSLAAINQVYNIDFQWYSGYFNRYSDEIRETSADKWSLNDYPKGLKIGVIRHRNDLDLFAEGLASREPVVLKTDFSRYILLYCTLGKVDSPEYRIKITEIAQRGNVVEVKVSMNSPVKKIESDTGDEYSPAEDSIYMPEDLVRVDKTALSSRGNLYFIFKTQSGKQIADMQYIVE